MHRTHHVRIDGIGICNSGNAEIRHFYFAFCGNNNILRLDIPVNNMFVMSCFNAPAYLNGNADSLFKGNLAFFLDICFQGDSFHIFHNNIMDGIFTSHIINIHNIRMFQYRRRLSFCPELCDKVHILGKFRFQYLDSHKAAKGMVFRFVDIRHSSGPCFSHYFISVSQIDSLF